MKYILIPLVISALLTSYHSTAQLNDNMTISDPNFLPYDTLPSYPDTYNAGGICARMVDGLGFRYRWATEGLRDIDLQYRIDSTARTSLETMDHILGLSTRIINSVKKLPNVSSDEKKDLSWEDMRMETLMNFKESAQILLASTDEDFQEFDIIFQRGDTSRSFPFWHQLNGPIADALWHVGQVVSYRRASGNPIDSRVNVFMGKVRER